MSQERGNRPVIKEKFLLSSYVYKKMPKAPAVTIAGRGESEFSHCSADLQQGEITSVELIRG